MKIYRIYSRTYVLDSQVEAAVAFYEALSGDKCSLQFEDISTMTRSAIVGYTHVVGGLENGHHPYPAIHATYLVDSVPEFHDHLLQLGAEVLLEPQQMPHGTTMIARHPDGLLAEYVDGNTG